MGVSLLIFFVAIHLELGYTTHHHLARHLLLPVRHGGGAGASRRARPGARGGGAWTSARRRWQAFRKILVPYLMPAILSGALMSFTLSLDELIVTYFTASAATRTLPLEIFGRVKKGLDPTLNAISTVFILSTVVLVMRPSCSRRGTVDPSGPPSSRRRHRTGDVMKRSVLISIVAAVACCSAPARSSEEQPKELNLFAWSEYVPQAVIDGFTEGDRHQGQLRDLCVERGDARQAGLRREQVRPDPALGVHDRGADRGEAAARPSTGRRCRTSRTSRRSTRTCRTTRSRSTPCRGWSAPVGIVVNTDKITDRPVKGYADVFQEKYTRPHRRPRRSARDRQLGDGDRGQSRPTT